MHIVFIVGSYHPHYSAVGKCVGNVAEELSKLHQVTVISETCYLGQEQEEVYNNQRLIRVTTFENKCRNQLNKGIKSAHGIKKHYYKLALNGLKFVRLLVTICSLATIKKSLVKKYVEALNKVTDPIDVIIPSSMPFESVVAALKYKNKKLNEVKIIPYLFDQFVESNTLHRNNLNKTLKKNMNKNIERKTLIGAHSILAMHSLKDNLSKYYPDIRNIHYIEHPLVVNRNVSHSKSSNANHLKISYVGGLYKNHVVPDYLLEVFSRTNISGALLHFYIVGNCSNTVNSYCDKYPNAIINHGAVDKSTAEFEVSDSHILINIAEKSGIQMSSKIFEYMSSGAPIIHFYTVDNDVNLKILEKYPLALCLKQDKSLMNDNVRKFVDFCKEHHRSKIPFEKIEEIFEDATPSYTAKLVLDQINNHDHTTRTL